MDRWQLLGIDEHSKPPSRPRAPGELQGCELPFSTKCWDGKLVGPWREGLGFEQCPPHLQAV